jgi:hypothetical protein
MTRLSCYRFRFNEVRLWLSVIAYNLGNLWRRVLPVRVDNCSLTNLPQRLVKTGGRLQARTVLFAAAGRRASDAADCCAALADGIRLVAG